MINKICDKIKTGPIKTAVPYGSDRPAPPYVVVRGEASSDGRTFRIFAHMKKGQQTYLEKYIFSDVVDLLDGAEIIDEYGNSNILMLLPDYGELVADNDDGTISMERRFMAPQVFL